PAFPLSSSRAKRSRSRLTSFPRVQLSYRAARFRKAMTRDQQLYLQQVLDRLAGMTLEQLSLLRRVVEARIDIELGVLHRPRRDSRPQMGQPMRAPSCPKKSDN